MHGRKRDVTSQFRVLINTIPKCCLEITENDLRLSHLNLGHSNITSMPCPAETQFPNLTELNLIENNISCFSDVAELATSFANLHTLLLSDNPVSSFGENQQVTVFFFSLQVVLTNYFSAFWCGVI